MTKRILKYIAYGIYAIGIVFVIPILLAVTIWGEVLNGIKYRKFSLKASADVLLATFIGSMRGVKEGFKDINRELGA